MAQINNGTVYAVTDSAVIKCVYALNLSSINGDGGFTVGAEVQWGASGADEGRGYIVSYVGTVLKVRRKNVDPTDEAPVANDTVKLVSDPTVTFATVAALGAGSPPNWSTKVSNIPGAKMFTVAGGNTGYYSVASSTADTITLTAVYQGLTQSDARYSIVYDFTGNIGLPVVSAGDMSPVALLNRGFLEIDRRLGFYAALSGLDANSGTLSSSPTVLDFDDLSSGGLYDAGSLPLLLNDPSPAPAAFWESTGGDGFFTVPAKVKRLRSSLQVELSITPPSVIDLQIVHSASGSIVARTTQQAETASCVLQICSPIVSVTSGDTLKAQITSSNGGTVQNTTSTWFSVEAVELVTTQV